MTSVNRIHQAPLVVSTLVWTGTICHVLWRFYGTVRRELRPRIGDDLFEPGWIPGFKEVDVSDPEWTGVKLVVNSYFLAIIAQNVLLHLTPSSSHVIARIAVSTGFLVFTFGLLCTVLLFLIFIVTLLLSRLGNKYVLYAINLSLVYLVVYNGGLLQLTSISSPGNDDIVLMYDVAVSWSALRAISLGVDIIEKDALSLLALFCYFLYVPCIVAGPLINCGSFVGQLASPQLPNAGWAIKQAALSALRLSFWVLLIELMDHALFANAVMVDYKFVRIFFESTAGYFGLTVALMARFYVKYLIIYGTAEEAARLEGIWLPERPRCTLRLTCGAQVWRTFDRGLYLWFLEYIYRPLGGGFMASLMCFMFACFWHSSSATIQIWAVINCALVITERFLSKTLYPAAWIAAQCVLHWLAVGSNMFYLGGMDIGVDFFRYLFMSPQIVILAFFISLCACVVGRQYQKKDLQSIKLTKKCTYSSRQGNLQRGSGRSDDTL